MDCTRCTATVRLVLQRFSFFFFNDTATTEIYTLSLHDALPISDRRQRPTPGHRQLLHRERPWEVVGDARDRKSTRLNSSHVRISYAVFCLKKKKGKALDLGTIAAEQHLARTHPAPDTRRVRSEH